METNWLLDEILTGLQKLLCLGLDRQPAAEVLPGTVQAWHEVLTSKRAWRRSDFERVRAAFLTLAATAKAWPTPSDLIAALPRPEETEHPTTMRETQQEANIQVLMRAIDLGFLDEVEGRRRINAIKAGSAAFEDIYSGPIIRKQA